MNFREATPDDGPCLADIYRSCLTIADWLPEGASEKAHFDRDTEGERLFLVEEGGEVLGFVSVWEPDSFLHHLYVHPEAQGRGVGTLLLRHLRDHVQPPWRLKCACSNQRAHRFYRSRGWFQIEEGNSETGPYRLMAWAE